MSAIIEVVRSSAEILTPEVEILDYVRRIEVYGRTCYKSEERITEESGPRFVAMLCKRGHLSVLEHCSIQVRFICSRAMSHQLVRHRLGSYSQESTRFCNYGKSAALKVVVPLPIEHLTIPGVQYVHSFGKPRHRMIKGVETKLERIDPMLFEWIHACTNSYCHYLTLLEEGWKPEDARFVLPICLKTEVVTTYNLRQWMHVFGERALNPAAQWEIRRTMLSVLERFAVLMPSIYKHLLPPSQ